MPATSRPSGRPLGRVLVTGAGGLLGRAVCEAFGAAGAEVHALVGPPGHDLPAPPGATSASSADITDVRTLVGTLDGRETLVHLAGPPSVAESFRRPAAYARAHVVGTAAVLEAAAAVGTVRRLVHVSSAEVYGRPGRRPVAEDAPVDPRTPYAACKVGAEALVGALAPLLDLEVALLRPFSVYGPRSPRHSLIGALVHQILTADEVVLGDLRPVRDFVFVSDLAQAVLLAATVPLTRPRRVFNVGSGTGVSVAQLADRALEAVGRPGVAVTQGSPERPGSADQDFLVADPERARRELGWTAGTPLAEGLARCLRQAPS